MNTRRAALLAALLSVAFFVGPALLLGVYAPVTVFMREVHGAGREYYAVRALLQFSTGPLMSLLGYQALGAAAILWGLGSKR